MGGVWAAALANGPTTAVADFALPPATDTDTVAVVVGCFDLPTTPTAVDDFVDVVDVVGFDATAGAATTTDDDVDVNVVGVLIRSCCS